MTALYTSIFAAAALADARSKAQRRHDWEEKIAAVKAEVNELVDEEQRLLESLQSRRQSRLRDSFAQNRGLGITSNVSPITLPRTIPSQPTRSFHTRRDLNDIATPQIPEKPTSDWQHDAENVHQEEGEDAGNFHLEEENYMREEHEDMHCRHEFMESWVVQDTHRVKAIQKLALKQFAIRLVLRPQIAHRYYGVPAMYRRDFQVPQVNTSKLLVELNSLRRRINVLRKHPDSYYRDLLNDYDTMGDREIENITRDLDDELEQNLQAYMSNHMSLDEVILRISENLLNSVDPDRPKAFRMILLAFNQTRQNDINEILLRTVLPHRFYLSTPLIMTIFSFYRKSKNLKDFDLFLKQLTGDGWSANLGVFSPYSSRRVNGLEVVVPPLDSNNVLIYTELIISALRFNQPDRADAWLQAARRVGFFDNFNTLFSYLKFYSIRQDWEKGSAALKRATTYLLSATGLEPPYVDRLIVLMAHLCDSCGRKESAQALISAAMESGFQPELPSLQEDVEPITDPTFARWVNAAQEVPHKQSSRPLWQRCSDFAHAFGNHLQSIELAPDDTRSRQFTTYIARHAQNALHAGLASSKPQTQTSDERTEPSQPTKSTEATSSSGMSSSNEVKELKEEVNMLRELVFELRKHHIEGSFRREEANALPRKDLQSDPIPENTPAPQSASNPETEELPPKIHNVEFHKVAERLGQSEWKESPSEVEKSLPSQPPADLKNRDMRPSIPDTEYYDLAGNAPDHDFHDLSGMKHQIKQGREHPPRQAERLG